MNLYKENDLYVPTFGLLTYNSRLDGYGKEFDFVTSVKRHLERSGGLSIPRQIHYVCKRRVFLNGVPHVIPFNVFEGYFTKYVVQHTASTSENTATREETTIVLDKFFEIAHKVKKRTKSDVVHHLSAEVGEISECLIQPQRGGNIVEESIDAIVCALDVIYLELGTTHGRYKLQKLSTILLQKN
ncbi:hypothetical protein ALHIDCOG_00433 [Klebsiella phage CPRSB]|nr:hypothetical protein ALHIDCOG_00433 [Klebsiella phage CPRSB]